MVNELQAQGAVKKVRDVLSSMYRGDLVVESSQGDRLVDATNFIINAWQTIAMHGED